MLLQTLNEENEEYHQALSAKIYRNGKSKERHISTSLAPACVNPFYQRTLDQH